MMEKSLSLTERASDQVLRWPTSRSRNWTSTFLDSAERNGNILAVVAVGSAVRADVPSADIDLVVICGDPALLKAVPPLEVDLRAYPAAKVDSQLRRGHDMLGWAVRFGRVLYQRNNCWEYIRSSWDHRLPLPSSKLSRERAAAAHRHLNTVVQFGDVDAAHEQALSYLTHLARAELLDGGVYPASRPELAGQLRVIGNFRLAEWLDRLLNGDLSELSQFGSLSKLF